MLEPVNGQSKFYSGKRQISKSIETQHVVNRRSNRDIWQVSTCTSTITWTSSKETTWRSATSSRAPPLPASSCFSFLPLGKSLVKWRALEPYGRNPWRCQPEEGRGQGEVRCWSNHSWDATEGSFAEAVGMFSSGELEEEEDEWDGFRINPRWRSQIWLFITCIYCINCEIKSNKFCAAFIQE